VVCLIGPTSRQIAPARNPSVTSRLDSSLSLDVLPGLPDGDLPAFVRGSSLTEGAFRMARAAHGGFGHGDTDIDHPVAVAELLSEKGFDETVVAAALLHDTVEDTTLTTKGDRAGLRGRGRDACRRGN
jgi:hypothetical protein